MERKGISVITGTALIIVASLLVSTIPLPVHADVASWQQKGADIMPRWSTDFESASFDQSLINLRKTHANAVSFVIPLSQGWVGSTDIGTAGNTPTDESLVHAIQKAHSLGMSVTLKPHLDPRDGNWRALINPSDRDSWFGAYEYYLKHYAQLAQANNVEGFVIGTELINMSSDDQNPTNTAHWRTIIADLRKVYSGQLSYAANWGVGWADEKNRISFWDALDYAGVDAYYKLNQNSSDTSVSALMSSWSNWNQTDIMPFANKVGKPVIFSEVGYKSTTGSHSDPGDYNINNGVDQNEQANEYQALFSFWNNYDFLKGLYIWDWSSDPNAGGNNTEYTPQNKTAESILTSWFAGTASSTPYVAPTPAKIGATASVGSATVSINSSEAITGSVSNTGGAVSGTIVDVEVYSSQGTKMYQKFYEQQSFAAGESKTYQTAWTPSVADTYTVKVGVFNNNWSQNYVWNGTAATFTAGSATQPQQQITVVGNVAVSSTTNIGVALPFTATVTNTGGQLQDALVDIEIYDANNGKQFQQFFNQQTYASGEHKDYQLSWTPQSTGTYRIALGVFTNDWSKNYLWNGQAATFAVSNASAPVQQQPTPPPATTSTSTATTTNQTPPAATSTPPVATTTPSQPSTPVGCATQVPTNSYTACYFSDATLTTPKLTRTDQSINFDWGGGSPDSSLPSDNFGAVWQGNFTFTGPAQGSNYAFNVQVDDGVRLYVDNQLILDKWQDQYLDTQVTKALTPGTHLIRMEYFDHTGGARAKLNWSNAGPLPQTQTTTPTNPSTQPSNPAPTTPSTPPSNVPINVWWPTDNASIGGVTPFKAMINTLSIDQYSMFWQVDGKEMNIMSNNSQDYPHKESSVDVGSWNWNTSGVYQITFVAKDLNGSIIGTRTVPVRVTR